MNAVSPEIYGGDRIAISIKVDGKAVDDDLILSVETWAAANRIPRARIVLLDGQPDSEDFPASDSAMFVPGAKVVIAAGYGQDTETIHSGTIVRHSIRIAPNATSQLIVETADPLVAMTLARHSTLKSKTSDSDAISALVTAAGGTVGKNQAGKTKHETFIQYHSSDWDLILMRAEASGCIVLVEDKTADIVAPTANEDAVLMLEYGDSIVSLEATVDAMAEYTDGAVKSRSWSYTGQKVTEAGAESATVQVPGNLKPAALAGVFDASPHMAQTGAYLDQDALQGWSTARLIRSRLAQVQGSVKFQGSSLAKPGKFVELKGVGDRFNGKAFVGATRHMISNGDWLTTLQLGMPDEAFAREPAIPAPPAAGLVPPVRGLQTGQVKQVAQDPSGDYRVLVTLPLVEGDEGVWARLGQYYASNTFGAVFWPEIGDEVVLGFMDEDPANPIILASVYSKPRAPAYPPNDANDVKALVTRSKMEIWFDDKDVILRIKTPGDRIVRLDDKNGEIKVSDAFGNYILMDKSQVSIFSAKEMNLTSTTNMTIKCGASLAVSATAEYSLKSPIIKANADTQFSIQSAAMGEVKTGAVLTVKGALVLIN
jgi:Rhs element Vgr protein